MVLEYLIPVLVCFPFLMAIITGMIKNNKIRGRFVYAGSCIIMLIAISIISIWIALGKHTVRLYVETEIVNRIILGGEIALMILVIYVCLKYKRLWISLLSIAPTCLIAYLELFAKPVSQKSHIYIDRLSLLMCAIVAIIGGLICIYAVGYMHGYHHHHTEFKDRRGYFFALLFIFLGAMFGLVLSADLLWLDFFWEVTSICSFLLIGYTRSKEAIFNSFRQLWMNLLGGCGFAFAVYYAYVFKGTSTLADVVNNKGMAIPVAFLAFAALTKSAQLPFSQWLLGAMVAPTPSSALLHSATMVKAGVYLLVRLAPAMQGTQTGTMVSFIGGFTFFATSLLAISQIDGKKVLAYSTISNLGLITACCGIGKPETIWAAVFLIIFHAVSKSMLFQTVGAIENATGSRNIESMQSLIIKLPKLCVPLVIGIAGMFLAPFGMLIAKWAALKAFVDAKNVLLIIFLVYGSATTMFYWTKWLCKVLTRRSNEKKPVDKTKPNEYISIYIHSVLMVLLCALFPLLSRILVEPIVRDIFHTAEQVLSSGNLYIMIVLLVSVFVLPSVMYLFAKHINTKTILSYMSGVNYGNSTDFVNSFGEKQSLQLKNWYMKDWFGEKKLLPASIIIAAFVLCFALILITAGGVI